MSNQTLYIHPDVQIRLRHARIELDNFSDRRLFLLEPGELDLLVAVNNGPVDIATMNACQPLIDANILSTTPYSLPAWPWGEPSRRFHQLSSDTSPYTDNDVALDEHAARYQTFSQTLLAQRPVLWSPTIAGDWVELPVDRTTLSDSSLSKVLVTRRTHRTYLPKPLSLAQLGTLMYYSFANLSERIADSIGFPDHYSIRRSSPSSGGLAATDVYISLMQDGEIPAGIYYYCPVRHAIGLINEPITNNRLAGLLSQQRYAAHIAVGVWLVGRFDRHAIKYQYDRCYRAALLEAGHLSEAFLLVGTDMDLGTYLSVSFHDSSVSKILNLPDERMAPLLFVGAGHKTGTG